MISNEGLVEQMTDILVVNDLLEDVVQEADGLAIEQAVALHDTIGQVIKRGREAQAALEVHLTSIMELGERGDVEYRGQSYGKRKKADRERFDHDEIGRQLVGAVLDRMTGDADLPLPEDRAYIDGARDGARYAVQMMSDVYLSESTKAKVGELARYGINATTNADGSVRTKTFAGYELKVIPLMKGDQ